MRIFICLILISFLGLGCDLFNGGEDETGTVADIDGNVYQTVRIGNQIWMAENLKTTKYRDGTDIPNVTDNTAWTELSTGAYCYYDNESDSAETYGALYNWYAVNNTSGLAPEGWRVPTDDDWKALEMYLGMSQSDADGAGWRGAEGGKLKSTSGWYNDGNGTDEVGFAALPGGCRLSSNGTFNDVVYRAYFWSASEYDATFAWWRGLTNGSVAVRRHGDGKRDGFSVRCVKDAAP